MIHREHVRTPFIGIALLLIAIGGPAQARPEMTTQMSRPTRVSDIDAYKLHAAVNHWAYRAGLDRGWNSYSAALSFAQCVTKFEPDAAERLLKTPIGDPKDRAELVRLVRENRGCTGAMSAVSPVLLRAALAETTLTRAASSAEPPATAVGIPHEVLGFPLLDVARCHLSYAPGRVTELLKTEPGGKDERVIAEDLFSRTPECGTTEGLGGIEATVVRLALVEAAYSRR